MPRCLLESFGSFHRIAFLPAALRLRSSLRSATRRGPHMPDASRQSIAPRSAALLRFFKSCSAFMTATPLFRSASSGLLSSRMRLDRALPGSASGLIESLGLLAAVRPWGIFSASSLCVICGDGFRWRLLPLPPTRCGKLWQAWRHEYDRQRFPVPSLDGWKVW